MAERHGTDPIYPAGLWLKGTGLILSRRAMAERLGSAHFGEILQRFEEIHALGIAQVGECERVRRGPPWNGNYVRTYTSETKSAGRVHTQVLRADSQAAPLNARLVVISFRQAYCTARHAPLNTQSEWV